MVDVLALKAEIVRKGLTQKEFAIRIGMSEQMLIRRFKSNDFRLDEAEKIINCLDLKNPIEIFFAK